MLAPSASTPRRFAGRASTRTAYRTAVALPDEPTALEALAAGYVGRLNAGSKYEWDARLETSLLCVLAYLWRRGRSEKWAGSGGSAAYGCSIAQLVVGLAPIMGWGPVPPPRSFQRRKFIVAHRTSVARWLDWLERCGLAAHTPERDDEGWWWRTVIHLQPAPPSPPKILAAVRRRRKGWTRREARRRALGLGRPRGRRLRDLSALLRRRLLTRAERRRRCEARRRTLAEQAERIRVRAQIHDQFPNTTSDDNLSQPFGASPTSQGPSEWLKHHETLARTLVRARSGNQTNDLVIEAPLKECTERAGRMAGAAPGVAGRALGFEHAAGQVAGLLGAGWVAGDPDSLGWTIAREIAARYVAVEPEAWAEHRRTLKRRLGELAAWPAGRLCPRSRILEAWMAIAWGESYAVAGGGPRLPLWRESNPHHGARLDRALARYERYSAVRPPAFPEGGVAGLLAWVRVHHGEHTPPRCLAYDVAGFDRFTKAMRAYARANDPRRVDRAAARAARRQAQGAYQAQHNKLGFRRTPATAQDALAQAQAAASRGTLGAEHVKRQLATAEHDISVLGGRLPANLAAAAGAYQRRWLSSTGVPRP